MARLPAPVSTAVTAQAAAADARRKPNTAAREPPPGSGVSAPVASRTVAGKQKVSQAAAEANSGKRKLAVPGVSQEAKEKSTVENNRNKVPQKQTVTGSQSRPSAVDVAGPHAAASATPVKPSSGTNATAKRSKTAAKKGDKVNNSKGVNGVSSTSSGNNRRVASTSRSSDALYTLLGVSKTATSAEIGKAYRALALLLHPDKVVHRVQQQQKQQKAGEGSPTGKKHSEAEEKGSGHEPVKEEYIEKMRQEATRHFQELQRAYTVLKDPTRRKLYDATGLTGEDGEEPQTFEEAYAFYRKLFPEIDLCAIEKFREEYLGSEAEKEDIREFCENEKEHLPRYVKILTEFVEKKELPKAKKLTKRAIEQLKQQADKMDKLTAREAAQLQKQKGSLSSEKPPKKRKEADSDGLQALALAIQANVNKRAREGNMFLDKLTQKYGGRQGADGRKSRGK